MLLKEFGTGVVYQILRLHREANENLALTLMFSEPAKDILSALQTDGKIVVMLLDLLLGIDGWAVVGYGTTHDYDIAVSAAISDGIKHILGTLNIHFLNACERLDAYRTGYESDISTTEHCHLGNGIAHLARGVVGDETHGVDSLLGRTSGDKNPLALEVLFLGQMQQDML
jgi:hypothetical protein